MYGNIIPYIRASFSSIYPPQVDEYRCENRRVRWWIYGAEQEKDGKRKPDKAKPDKAKRENDKGLKKTKPPKRDGLASIL